MLTGSSDRRRRASGGAPRLSPLPAASMIGAPAAAAAAATTPPPAQAPFTPATQTAGAAGGATITGRHGEQRARRSWRPSPLYNNLRAIIEKLDVRRAQVFVEALIVEVSADKAAEFGIQWQALARLTTRRKRA